MPRLNDAYLSAPTHLPGCDYRDAASRGRVCGVEDIYAAETEFEVELGYVEQFSEQWLRFTRMCVCECETDMWFVLDDWLIIVPLLLSIALIGPSYRREFIRDAR